MRRKCRWMGSCGERGGRLGVCSLLCGAPKMSALASWREMPVWRCPEVGPGRDVAHRLGGVVMRSGLLRLGLVALLAVGGAGSIARADTIKFSGTVVGSGSDKEDDDHAKGYSGDYVVTFDYT